MRLILQLCVLLTVLLGVENHAWGKVAAPENIAVRGFEEGEVFGDLADAPPALMSAGEAAAWGYDVASDVRDGPNVYAYVKQNPWTAWDPDGLATTLDGNGEVMTKEREPKKLQSSVYSKRVIFEYETGGEENYNSSLKRPTWPGGASGVTIGVGYDLGYNSQDQIQKDWSPLLESKDVNTLKSVAGIKGKQAEGKVPDVRSVIVPLEAARKVFDQNSVPRFSTLTDKAFPGATDLHPLSQGALLSLVFNRGDSMAKKDSRKEMREIRNAIASGRPERVPQLIQDMKRLWEGKKMGGLLLRRDEEAQMFEVGLMLQRHIPTDVPANPFPPYPVVLPKTEEQRCVITPP